MQLARRMDGATTSPSTGHRTANPMTGQPERSGLLIRLPERVHFSGGHGQKRFGARSGCGPVQRSQ